MDKIEKIRAEIERLIEMNKTKNGFPAGTICAVRIEAYEHLLSFLSTLSEEPDKSLEEAADKHIRKVVDAAGHPGWDWTTQDIADAFIAGAKWQKEQMLKDAVEGRIGAVGLHNSIFIKEPEWAETLDRLNEGDKVKIIILKEA